LLSVAAVVGLIAVLVLVSVIGALRSPGNQSFEAKWADWLRSHHAASVANQIENYYYSHHVPARGGSPRALNPVPPASMPTPPSSASATSRPTTPSTTRPDPHLAPPRPVALVVRPGLPGEGQWRPAGALVDGRPAIYVSQFRADTIYTSQITSAVWMDPTLVRLGLVPGTQEPGGSWPQTPYIGGPGMARVLAAFNGGFRMADAHGGFFLDGRQAVPLRAGAASFVLYTNGRVDIGSWGPETRMSPAVVAVLQNLVPIVDHGQIAPDATYNDTAIWGATLGANTVVARSGVGVTADGALVYVAGPALTARTLAESLVRAGAVRAMTLDINPEWVTFNFYEHSPTNPYLLSASKLYPQMQRPATRYLGPTNESRDFFTVSLP
jgi:hypothetical protein